MALTDSDVLKVLQNKLTKSEFEAFRRGVNQLAAIIASGNAYVKPNDGIPKGDLSQAVQSKLSQVDQCYQPGVKLAEDDLPEGVASSDEVLKATRGLINTSLRANRTIDEVYNAREGKTSVVANLQDNYSLKNEIISNLNTAGESGTIDKEHVEPPAHSEVTGTTADNLHPMNSIQGLTAALSAKVDTVTIIATINLSAETPKISVSQIDMSGLLHNSIGGRDTAGAHPQSAITDLVSDLSDLDSRMDSVEGAITTLNGFEAQQNANNNCLADAIAVLLTNAGLAVPACIQALETPT